MRSLYFLLPGTTKQFACGGLWVELKTLEQAKGFCHAEVVTYRQREAGVLFLDDLLQSNQLDRSQVIFVVSWGFDVPKLVRRLQGWPVLYHAHSAGYGFRLPSRIPIITVSRNTLGYWGQHAPQSPLFYLPNQIGNEFSDRHLPREIDVLVQARKSSSYVLEQLVPALKAHCTVEVLDRHVPDLAALFNRAKIYLYDSAEYWAQHRVTEGFGMPPLEAMACGCHVFSSVNSALADYLDPGFNCHKIAVYSLEYDLQQILKTLQTLPPSLPESHLAPYRQAAVQAKLQVILEAVNHFFDHQQQHPATIPELTPQRLWQLSARRIWGKVKQKLKQR